jgi:hypothetical protein
MANNLESNPIGINTTVYQIQKKLYDKLTVLWDTEIDAYPICYSIKREGDKTKSIEFYQGDGEYSKNLIHRERNKFFFTADNDLTQKSLDYYSTDIDLYFILNLKECKSLNTNRADKEVINDVLEILKQFEQIGITTKIVTELERVFQGYTFDFKHDLQPYFCFKLTLPITDFTLNDKLC